VRMEDKPSQALRYGRWKSSMWLAIDAVKKRQADVAVSAGNTGALMAMAKFELKTLAGIERPAIAAIWPTVRGQSIVLDVGASIGADAEHLADLAVMGAATARILLGVSRPSVGLLNIGVEEVKGLEQVREAGRILREAERTDLDYVGFVEGDDIGQRQSRCRGYRRLCRQHRAQDLRRDCAPDRRIHQSAMGRRWSAGSATYSRAQAFQELEGPHGSAPSQRRRLSRPQRHLSSRATAALTPRVSPPRSKSATASSAMSFWPRSRRRSDGCTSRSKPSAGPHHDGPPLGHSRLRELSAEPGRDQRRSRRQGGYLRRMDRAAHRHP
jgi:hypothetical protein